MKHLLLYCFLLTTFSGLAQSWNINSTSDVLYTPKPDTKIGIGPIPSQIINEKFLLYADTITDDGGRIAIRCLMGSYGDYFQGYVDGRVGTVGNWSSQGQGSASSGTLTLLRTAAIGSNSSTGAGVFSLKLQDYNNSGSYTNYAAASLSLLNGTISNVTNHTVTGAVVGVDNINIDSTWAGYFIGKGYFSGKVGIGTKATSSALTVKGKIDCEEIEVKNIGADYVFDKEYELLPLDKVETYINENGHLPGIAPASETEKGVNLSEFSEQLLKKVEELTLYMIELKKENEKLKEEVKALSIQK